ncbi:MAG: S41 family peptidase [Oscillospiraceae bacterium]
MDQSIDLVRRKMDIPTIDYRLIGANGFIRIKEFNDNTPEQFKAAIEDLQANGAKGLVFDVRNNGGGTIDSVAEMLDMLLPEGPIVTAYSKDGTEVVNKQSDANEINLPMCVLTNERTASAAELFACALRDYDKAKLVGTKTYGKGVMQRVFPLSDGSALDITIAKYNPPKSENYDGVGLTPDYEVKLSAELQNIFYELTEINDPQLQKAIEVVNAVQ